MQFDIEVNKILKEQANDPSWLFQPLKRLSSEVGDWQLRRLNPQSTAPVTSNQNSATSSASSQISSQPQPQPQSNPAWEAEQQRRAGLSPQQKEMERSYGVGNTSMLSAQDKKPIIDDLNNKNKEYIDSLKRRYPNADHTNAEAYLAQINNTMSLDIPSDPVQRENLLATVYKNRQNLQDQVNAFYNKDDWKQYYNSHLSKLQKPQQSSDPFQARVDQMNRSNQQWASNPGIRQVALPQQMPFTATKY